MLTIELIEDDIGMRSLFSEWLRAEGYRLKARVDLPARSGAIDVALVVVDLPQLPALGAERVRRVRSIYPGAVVIATSAQLTRSLGRDSQQVRSLGVEHLVAKPCARAELVEAVFDAIGRAG